jgi:hypothetical protein
MYKKIRELIRQRGAVEFSEILKTALEYEHSDFEIDYTIGQLLLDGWVYFMPDGRIASSNVYRSNF